MLDHKTIERIPKAVKYGAIKMPLCLREREHFDAPIGDVFVERLLVEFDGNALILAKISVGC